MKKLFKYLIYPLLGTLFISATPKSAASAAYPILYYVDYEENGDALTVKNKYKQNKGGYTHLEVSVYSYKTGETTKVLTSIVTYVDQYTLFMNDFVVTIDDTYSQGVSFIFRMYFDITSTLTGEFSCYYIPKRYTSYGVNKTIQEKDSDTEISTGYLADRYIDGVHVRTYDSFKSSTLEDVHVLDLYNRFSIDYFSFYFNNGNNDYTDGWAIFEFYYPYDDYLQDFPNDGKGNFYLNFNIEQLDKASGLYRLRFEDYFYYDPNTHAPYYTEDAKEGLIKTDCIYFPINKIDQFEGLNCKISISFPEIEATYTNSFSLTFLKDLLGECSTSKYCVLTDVDNNENYQEKVVVVTYA